MDVLDKAAEIIEQPGKKIIEEHEKDFSKQIKRYAQEFLNVLRQDQKELEDIEKALEREEDLVKRIEMEASTDYTYEWRVQIQNRHLMTRKDYYREIISAMLKFQTQLNELLDQKVELVYVYQNENNDPVLYTINEEDLLPILYYEKSEGKIRGRFFESTAGFLQALKNLTKYELFDKFNLRYFNYTYKQILWRFNQGRKRKGVHLILWLNPNFRQSNNTTTKWLKAQVGQRGDIKEAYSSIVLDRQINEKKLFNDEKLDNNVHAFMEELAKVDDESGLLKGDVTVGQVEYAIKGASAKTMGLQQTITVAQKIIETFENGEKYTKRNLQEQKQEFHKAAKSRNHIEQISLKLLKKQQEGIKKMASTISLKNKIGMSVLVDYQPSDLSAFYTLTK